MHPSNTPRDEEIQPNHGRAISEPRLPHNSIPYIVPRIDAGESLHDIGAIPGLPPAFAKGLLPSRTRQLTPHDIIVIPECSSCECEGAAAASRSPACRP